MSIIKFEDLDIAALTIIASEQYEECLWAIEKALDKQLAFGRLLRIVKEKLPHGEWGTWVRETFTDHKSLRTIQRYMRGADSIATDPSLLACADSLDAILKIVEDRKPAVEVAASVPTDNDAEIVDPVSPPITTRAHVANNSGNNEWYTPQNYIDAARLAMGGIDLDPASSEAANEIVKAGKFFTADDDGLSQDWTGRVWMNPPYSKDLIGRFAEKFAESVESGSLTAGCVLVNNATETKWFQRLAEASSAICFLAGRVRFWSTERESATPLQGQAVLYAGKDTKAFFEAFNSFGFCAWNRSIK